MRRNQKKPTQIGRPVSKHTIIIQLFLITSDQYQLKLTNDYNLHSLQYILRRQLIITTNYQFNYNADTVFKSELVSTIKLVHITIIKKS